MSQASSTFCISLSSIFFLSKTNVSALKFHMHVCMRVHDCSQLLAEVPNWMSITWFFKSTNRTVFGYRWWWHYKYIRYSKLESHFPLLSVQQQTQNQHSQILRSVIQCVVCSHRARIQPHNTCTIMYTITAYDATPDCLQQKNQSFHCEGLAVTFCEEIQGTTTV